ncbi:MAG TPA: hypothetical protein VGH38_00470 [Bryobacteraceae bacterium]
MFYKLFLTAILTATLALAQGRGGGGGSDMGDMGGMGGANGRGNGVNLPSIPSRPARLDQIALTLKLDKEQKKVVKTVMDAAQKEATPVHEQMVKSRLSIGEAIQGGKSQDEITQLVGSESVLESQMAGIEMGAFVKIYKILEKDQQALTAPVFQMMKGVFSGKNWNIEE